jgi:C4-dicarboxylate-specific signal transduction histidine kinase
MHSTLTAESTRTAPATGNLAAQSRDDNEAVSRRAAAWQHARAQIAVILTFGICVTALLWLIMFVVIKTERSAALDHARSEANNLSAAFQEEVGQTLASVSRTMESVAQRMRAAKGQFDIHEWAREIPLLAAAVIQCAIIGPDGIMRSSTLETQPSPLDLSDREHFRVHADGTFKGLFVSKPVVGRVSGQTALQVSQRVEDANGTFLGVVVFSLAPGQLTTLHKSIDLGPGGRLVVAGTADNVIRARYGSGSEAGDLGAAERVPPLPAFNAAPHRGDDTPVQSFVRESVVDHATRLYSMRNVHGYPLRVAVAFDLSQVLAPAATHARLLGVAGVIATLMMGGLMTLLVLEIRRRTDREIKLGDEQARLAAEIRLGEHVQQQLRSSEARLRDFAEMASDWFWETDADLRFTSSTIDPTLLPSGLSPLGKQPWELLGTSVPSEQWIVQRREMIARKSFRDFRHTRPDASDRPRHVSMNGVPVYGDGGGFVGYRGTGRDVTARMEAEAELRRSKETAEASSVAKSAFLANMSHELRTPLNAIIGFAELIHARKTGRITNDYVEWAGDILSSGRHLLDLINDVLELSRIEAGRYELTEDTIDLGLLARACLPMIRGQAEKNRVRIDHAIVDKTAVVRADRRAIKQVVLNLLTNAVKFTPGGGVVSIRSEKAAGGEVSLVVADTGIGIDPAALSKLCQPFVQADASTSRRYGGTGLGLAISNRLVGLHGGTLTIASVLGQGTKVWVTFPVSRVMVVTRQEIAAE